MKLARKNKISTIALTDHDCTDGIAEALKYGKKKKIEVIPGIEFSCYLENEKREVHILGYLKDWENKQLQSFLKTFRNARKERARRIIQKLHELGVMIDEEKVFAIGGDGTIGRPHIARVMVESGAVPSMDIAFNVYLNEGAKAYVKKKPFTIEAAITLTHKAGGLAVWAHPHLPTIKRHIKQAHDAGLDGIEVYHPYLLPGTTRKLRNLARRYGLYMTGGSDWHREQRNGSFGDQAISYKKVEPFIQAFRSISL